LGIMLCLKYSPEEEQKRAGAIPVLAVSRYIYSAFHVSVNAPFLAMPSTVKA
jgi:hypothetical protein